MMGLVRMVWLIILIPLFSLPASGQDAMMGSISFIYRDGQGVHSVEPDTDKLFVDEDFKIVLASFAPKYVYLIHKASDGTHQLLKSGRLDSGDIIFFPSRDDWFRLDAVSGIETFYIVYTTKREISLETAFKNPHDAKRDFLVKEGLKRLFRRDTGREKSSEIPTLISSSFRGSGDIDYQSHARYIPNEDPYIEVIGIRH